MFAFFFCWYPLYAFLKFVISKVLADNFTFLIAGVTSSTAVGFFVQLMSREGKYYSLLDISCIASLILIVLFFFKSWNILGV